MPNAGVTASIVDAQVIDEMYGTHPPSRQGTKEGFHTPSLTVFDVDGQSNNQIQRSNTPLVTEINTPGDETTKPRCPHLLTNKKISGKAKFCSSWILDRNTYHPVYDAPLLMEGVGRMGGLRWECTIFLIGRALTI